MKLREYQIDIIERALNTVKHTLIQLPTGAGKTIIAKEIASKLRGQGLQVLFIAPKIILMEQTAEEFDELEPVIVHGEKKFDHTNNILISTIQTAGRRDLLTPDVIIVDEIHHGYDGVMIKKLILKPDVRVIGLSATPYDRSGKKLKGFDVVLDKYDLQYMVDQKYLIDPKAYVLVRIKNLDKVKVIAGDYNLKQLSKIVSSNQTILQIVNSTEEYIEKHKKAILFAVDINHAELITDAYKKRDLTAEVLHSKMKPNEIKQIIEDFKIGKIKILVSVLMLTTGFDVPDTDLAIIARPTRSQNLYKQMIGRVLRLAHDKKNATILDCGNVIETLGMPLDPIRETDKKNISLIQKCEQCNGENMKLKKIEKDTFWVCLNCGIQKKIEQGVYKCKYCNLLYTHNAVFIQKNNKLYLHCESCQNDTLISEYLGDENFLEVLYNDEEYLPYNVARDKVRKLRLTSKKEWQELIGKVKDPNRYVFFPKGIPYKPSMIYKNSGWKGFSDWLGIEYKGSEVKNNSKIIETTKDENNGKGVNMTENEYSDLVGKGVWDMYDTLENFVKKNNGSIENINEDYLLSTLFKIVGICVPNQNKESNDPDFLNG